MGDTYLLPIIVLCATAIWPLGRFALSGGGSPKTVGFWVSLTAGLLCFVGMLKTEDWQNIPFGLMLCCAAMGVAYAFGFWMCIMRALQTGPSGPTVTVNNMAMSAGVLYGLILLTPGRATFWTWIGLAGVCAALILLGLGNSGDAGKNSGADTIWKRLLVVGGLLSCVSFISQTHAGTVYPSFKFAFGAAAFGFSALLLLPGLLRGTAGASTAKARNGGIAVGVLNAAIQPLTLMSIERLGAEVVLPVAVATPILLVLVIGSVFYKERLSRMAIAGCIIGAGSVAVLAF